tara:strand:+ start:22800 stop:23846 length:1047 start_codon:yes stop_codon:yes gene_type:complete
MKILVTGGSGFIGSNFIISQLQAGNHSILNFDKLTYAGSAKNLDEIKSHPNYKFVHGDICDKNSFSSAISSFQPDTLVNFAAESHVDRSIETPMDFIHTNIVGTANILQESYDYWKTKGCTNFKFIHISTDEVFGSLDNNGFFSENSPYNPSSPYSASKASSDHLVRAWFHTYKLPILITNCSNNYGSYQFPEKLIPLMIINCLNEKSLPVYGQGLNIRDWLYVSDHCEAIMTVLNNGIVGETYTIGGNNEIKNIDIVTKICSILDDLSPRRNKKSYMDLIKFVDDRPGHDFRYAIDASKIKQQLGWEPKETFDSGILKTIHWYLNNKNWWKQIQKNTYNQERLGLGK